jgi:Uma2 family endonuclease
MARVPLTKEEVAPTRLVLNIEKVGLTEEQFFQLCSDNRDLRLELTARKELIIMSPTGLKSGWREIVLCTELTNWTRKDGTGIAIGPSTAYRLPNGAIRGPDASWIRRERLAAFTDKELEKFGHLCPDFAAEVRSPSDTLAELQDKMSEYIANGAQLGWLIDPFETRAYVYRPGQAVECLENPTTISGDAVLPGFIFNVAEIW